VIVTLLTTTVFMPRRYRPEGGRNTGRNMSMKIL